MYAYLKGNLVSFNSTQAVLDVHGIGYNIFIPCSVLGQLPHIGQAVQFYTSFVIREFSQALYGFLSSEERDAFEVLLNVTGVGPKLAISLIGHLPHQQLHAAITNADLTTLCKVPGVGKKTAERLVIELRDKLPHFMSSKVNEFAINTSANSHLQSAQDAILALINLGYNQSDAQKAVKQALKELDEQADLASIITTSLKNIYKS